MDNLTQDSGYKSKGQRHDGSSARLPYLFAAVYGRDPEPERTLRGSSARPAVSTTN